MQVQGDIESFVAKEIFHAQNFPEALFMLKVGYVKRYQITRDNKRVIELIYGPGHIFPLSQLYKKLFGIQLNQDNLVYVYEAMTDITITSLSDDRIVAALEADPMLYQDLFFEGGLRLKSNIERLASNALLDDYKKVAHQLVCLADEFGISEDQDGISKVVINVPLVPLDMAEQLNISVQVAEAVLSSLSNNGIIEIENNLITVPNLDLLKDTYL